MVEMECGSCEESWLGYDEWYCPYCGSPNIFYSESVPLVVILAHQESLGRIDDEDPGDPG